MREAWEEEIATKGPASLPLGWMTWKGKRPHLKKAKSCFVFSQTAVFRCKHVAK